MTHLQRMSRRQAVKCRRCEGMTHRDLLRLAHPAGSVGPGNLIHQLTPRDASAALAP
jgi:hypothetical protein